jgi:hypothetical protein
MRLYSEFKSVFKHNLNDYEEKPIKKAGKNLSKE